ncbi:DUF2182 domain-containing protein [Flexibacterium corallicola]|uniref:DUF2182 domain-containing protein n=1 Tax=Flexibacterium corallicola TaxID=3037259 RepID=UPI00286F2CAF|nr:DUF2182 domain-containing protein [Pseudovibrio sp. M1P-2-3]
MGLGWLYLGFMVVDMVPRMDMGTMGPGMEVFNKFNMFSGLDPIVRAQLASLCLPFAGDAFGMPALDGITFGDFALIFMMWIMMVLAMMLPSSTPMLKRYLSIQPGQGVLIVALGYVLVWAMFSFFVTALQLALHKFGTLNEMMAPTIGSFAVTITIFTGIYQFTPWKLACLARCRLPKVTKADHVEAGVIGALRFGIEQGVYCLGCCWALMVLMFAVGVMNILWIAVLGLMMAFEKKTNSIWFTYCIGGALILWGCANIYFSPTEFSLLDMLWVRLFR